MKTNGHKNHKSKSSVVKPLVNEREIADFAKDRKAKAWPLRDAIDAIVLKVDENFPSAFNPQSTVSFILGDEPGMDNLANSFLTTNHIAQIERFWKLNDVWQKVVPDHHKGELAHTAMQYVIAAESLPLVLGFAAGLRTAGYSRGSSILALRSFLRNLDDDLGDVKPSPVR